MSVKKGGLNIGKGLQNLIPTGKDNTASGEKQAANEFIKEKPLKTETKSRAATAFEEPNENEIVEVRISLVIPNADQPRKEFDKAALAELAESIAIFGILQPLIVQKKGKYYEIIAGERRWRAAKLAGLRKVPVIIREYTHQEVMEISLIENIQREDLNPIEEAHAFKRLLEEFNLKQADIAKRVSKSRAAITNSMRLLKLDERVQKMLADGLISAGHARALLGLENIEMQYEAAARIVSDALSVRDTEKLIQRMKKPAAPEAKEDTSQMDAVYDGIEEQLKSMIGSKVSIKRKSSGKGTIEISYFSTEDLERILDIIRKGREEQK